MRSAALRVLVAVAGLLVVATPATAAIPVPGHARLLSSSPAADAVLPEAPTAVVLGFTRDIAPPATVVLTGPGGGRLETPEPTVDGPTVSTPVVARERGSYRVAYRAVSVDGHPIAGSFVFSVGHRSTLPARTTSAGWPWVRWVVPGVAAVVVAGAVVGWRRRPRRRDG
jgi:methionine-rich copper-binding protein CopC